MLKEPKNLAEGAESLLTTLSEIEELSATAERDFKDAVMPLRRNLIKRFPVTFLLIVTVGFASVSFGIEEFLHSQSFLVSHPLLVFFFGLLLLIITGSVYKRG